MTTNRMSGLHTFAAALLGGAIAGALMTWLFRAETRVTEVVEYRVVGADGLGITAAPVVAPFSADAGMLRAPGVIHEPPAASIATEAVDHAPIPSEARFEALRTSHDASPRDPGWARRAETSLWADLEAQNPPSNGFRIESVDCRTDSCRVELAWANHADAIGGWGALVHHSGYTVGRCARGTRLPDPPDPAAEYRVTLMVFDCER